MIRVAIAIAAAALALVNPAGLAAAQPQPVPDPQSRMRLEIDSLAPRVITTSTPTVTVTGKVTNIGDRRIDDIQVRLQRGERLATEQDLRDARNAPNDSARSPFLEVSRALEVGQSAPVTLTVPVRGGAGSLRVDQPGVYPLLVNVNGKPDFGGPARLAAAFVLLPALSVPGGPTPAPAADPARLTVLWPLIDDHPRRLPTTDGRPLLVDDDLADSLAPGGRLYGLVNTVQQAAETNPDLLDALCFAVDPDLLETVQQMTAGYRVRQPGGEPAEGRGTAIAEAWLERLRALASGRCVITVPYADADLVALSRAGAVDLEKLALSSASVVGERLAPGQLAGVLWPADGTLDQRTLLDLAGTGTTTVLADPTHLRDRQGSEPYLVGESAGAVRAVPIDTLVSSFLDDGQAQANSAIQPAAPPEERPGSVQNGLAALAFRTAFAGADGASLVIAPPRRWAAPTSELSVLLGTVEQVIAAGLARPQRLGETVSGAPRGSAAGWDYTARNIGAEITPSVTAEVVRINSAQRDLLRAMQVDDTRKVAPEQLVTPLEYGLLRATSTAWRGRPDLADRAVAGVSDQLDALLGQVTVVNPGRPLTLGSTDSPIPVQLRNSLPVSIVVRINFDEVPGLRPGPTADVLIPAGGSVNRLLQAEVTRAGRFTLDVSLSTPGGTPLGTPARHELSSTAHGLVTLIVTGTAAGALLLLVVVRIFRRVRTRPTEERAD